MRKVGEEMIDILFLVAITLAFTTFIMGFFLNIPERNHPVTWMTLAFLLIGIMTLYWYSLYLGMTKFNM